MHTKARIRYKGFDRKESLKLRPLLPIAEIFAERLGKEIILDAPGGIECPNNTEDETTRRYVHILSVPPYPTPPESSASVALPARGYASELFFFPVPVEGLTIEGTGSSAVVRGTDVGLRLKSRPDLAKLKSPEFRSVAQIAGNHLYILFNLAWRPWKGRDVSFWEILEWATVQPGFKSEENENETEILGSRLAVQKKMRASLLAKQEELFLSFVSFSRIPVLRELERTHRAIAEKRPFIDIKEEEMSALRLKIELFQEVENRIELDETLSTSYLYEEFETIHRLRGLLGIEIRHNELHVFTEPIEHVRADERAQLSQFHIAIDPANHMESGNTVGGIKMEEYGWLGPFRHPDGAFTNANLSSPCFGQQFVPSVRKAFYSDDFRLTIALLLHYLDSDSRAPVRRQTVIAEPDMYEAKPFYINEAHRKRTHDDFVAFVKQFRGKLRKQTIAAEIKELLEQEEKAIREWANIRKDFSFLCLKEKYLTKWCHDLSSRAEFDLLCNMPALMHMHIGHDFLWLIFGPGKGMENFARMWFPGVVRILIKPIDRKIIMWGENNSQERLLFPPGYRDSTYKLFSEMGDMLKGWKNESFFAKGLMGRGIEALYREIRGDKTALEKQEPAPAKTVTEEELEVYLQNSVFPAFIE